MTGGEGENNLGGMIRAFNGKSPRIHPTAWVSAQATLTGDIEVGEGSSIWPGAILRADIGPVRIGRHCHIEEGCIVHGPVEMGDKVCLGHGAVVEGEKIGSYVLVGNNATILNGAQVADHCIIAAGSLVKEKARIPTRALVAGVPGEVRRYLQPQDIQEKLEEIVKVMGPLAQEYKKQGF